MNILEAILHFSGASIASGITWDLLKGSGERIIYSFKKKFIDNKYFSNESECDEFLKKILVKKPNSERNPFKDAQNIYEDIIVRYKEDFTDNFKQWINENKKDFEKIVNNTSQHVSVKIEHQENNGSGTIINAGIINNN